MFERSFIETSFNATNRTRRWTTLLSMALEMALVAVLVLLPLLFTEALPRLKSVAELAPPAPAAPRGGGGVRREAKPATVSERAVGGRVREPRFIPTGIDAGPVAAPDPYVGGGPGPVGDGVGNEIGVPDGGVPGGTGQFPVLVAVSRPALPTPPPAPERRIVVSEGVLEGLLIRRVVPAYPQLARNARVQGSVLLHAVISKDGTIDGLRLAAGHPLLAQAAMDAVRQWRYRPYMLNRQPVEVETEITVNFTLGH